MTGSFCVAAGLGHLGQARIGVTFCSESAGTAAENDTDPSGVRAGYARVTRSAGRPSASVSSDQLNWFIVFSAPPAFSAASPAKYSLWLSPMSLPAMFWCLTVAIP